MLKADSLIFEYLKHFTSETNLTVHHGFLNIDRAESLLTCNTCDCKFRFLACTLNNKGTLVFRSVCVFDINRNSLFTNREDRIFMKNGCTHIRKLSEFSVGNALDHFRIFNNTRVCYQETGNICPVFIEVCLNSLCHKRTGHIRAASGESFNFSIFTSAIKSRDNGTFTFCQLFGQKSVCLLGIQISVLIKTNHICCIYKFITQICCHYLTIEKFSSGCCIICACLCLEISFDLNKFIFQRKIKVQSADDLIVSSLDFLQERYEILPFYCSIITFIK